jgi:predicted aspartyl protease
MIQGVVTESGVPIIELPVAGRQWRTVLDTGFNSDLELPLQLESALRAKRKGPLRFLLAGGMTTEEIVYVVQFPFDGAVVRADATFVDGEEVLLGTGLLRDYRLEINFPERTVLLERLAK